jgi:hypothetical protein
MIYRSGESKVGDSVNLRPMHLMRHLPDRRCENPGKSDCGNYDKEVDKEAFCAPGYSSQHGLGLAQEHLLWCRNC